MNDFVDRRMRQIQHAQAQARYASKQPVEWVVWKSMKQRCRNHHHRSYADYGGRGVFVCPRWLERGRGFANFLEDMGKRPGTGFELDRIDPSGPYVKENCRWIPWEENQAKAHPPVRKEGMERAI